MKDYTLYSGGANGSDIYWEIIGKQFGLETTVHFYHLKKTPFGNTQITEKEYDEGKLQVTTAAKQMGRITSSQKISHPLLIRNWSQVYNSDAIFAISTIVEKNNLLKDGRLAKIDQVEGGTGYAVQMAINNKKPVYVFDQELKMWFTYYEPAKRFLLCGIPILTKNFAGIGTRELNEFGIQAIKDVYEQTTIKENN